MRDCDFVAASSEVVVDWLHLVTVARKSRPPLRYEFNVEDPLDAALASETLRLCARDGIYAVAGAVARISTPQRRPVEAPVAAPGQRRPAMIAPKTFDAFRLRRPPVKTKDVLDARALKKVKSELEPKLARRGKAVARETLDVAKVEKLLKSVDSNATSQDAERALRFLDFDERGTVDAFAAYRYALEATPRLLRQRAAGAAQPRPLLKDEDAFDVPATGVLQLRCFLERTVRGSRSANVLKLVQDLDDCVAAADLAAKARVKLDVDDALALARSLAEREDCTDVGAVALVAPLTVDPRDARCVRDEVLGRLFSYKADAEERLSIVERYRALRAKLGPGHRAFLGPRDGRYALDLTRPGDRTALCELFAVDAFRNCRIDGSSQPLGITIGREPPKRDAQLAALFTSEGAPSLGSRTDGLVVLDVASPAPPQPETTPALDSTVFVDACEAFGWCRSDEQRRAWATLVEGPRPADKPTKRLFGGARCSSAAFIELFRLRSLVKAGLPDVRRRSQSEPLTVAGSCESLGRARRRSSDASQRRAAPDVALEDALDLIGAAPSVTVNQARALLRWCPLADDGLPAQVPVPEDDDAWSTEEDACSGRRARLTCALLAKLRAPIDVAALFDILTPPERARVVNQAGWANVWSPLRPDGSYVLNLALPEDRQIARSLTHVEASETYSQLLDLRLLDVPSIENWAAPAAEKVVEVNPWRKELPAKGVWGITFKSKSDDPRDSDLSLRAALACLTSAAPPEAFALVPDAPFGKSSPAIVARKSRSQLKGACRLEDAVYDWERPIV